MSPYTTNVNAASGPVVGGARNVRDGPYPPMSYVYSSPASCRIAQYGETEARAAPHHMQDSTMSGYIW